MEAARGLVDEGGEEVRGEEGETPALDVVDLLLETFEARGQRPAS